MVRIEQFIKKVNNTELGKTGTHETYVQVPNDVEISGIFPTPEEVILFKDKLSHKHYGIRLTIGREHRICGMGEYYRDNALSAGDEVLFEKRDNGQACEYYIVSRKLSNTILLRKGSNGYEVLTPEHLSLLSDNTVEFVSGKKLEIVFFQSTKRRSDSQDTTDYYRILLDGSETELDYSSKDLIELEIHNEKATIRTDFTWKTITFDTEE